MTLLLPQGPCFLVMSPNCWGMRCKWGWCTLRRRWKKYKIPSPKHSCVCTHVHAYTQAFTCTYTSTHLNTHIYNSFTHVHVHTQAYKTYVHIYICKLKYMHVYTSMHMYICTRKNKNTYTLKYTHVNACHSFNTVLSGLSGIGSLALLFLIPSSLFPSFSSSV